MKLGAVVVPVLVAALAAGGIARVQPGLAANVHKIKQREDVFLLPPPAELRALTLGYRAAATDFLWAQLVYQYGLHWQEKRGFPDITRYIDGVLALEPDFPTLYAFVDTVLVYSPTGGTEDDARTARRYLEQGTRERPFDPKVWLQCGQFMAFLAPSFLKEETEIQAWRKDGAQALSRAVELGADADRSLAVSSILGGAGEHKAAIQHLERVYAITEDPELRQQMLYKLQREGVASEAEAAMSAVEREWRTRWPFLSRNGALLVGPRRPPATCAGPASYEDKKCPHDWSAFVEAAR